MATSITFEFWSSDNGVDWTGPETDIADVDDSRYIKVKASLSGDANTVPTLKDMTVGYFKKSNILANWIYFNDSKEDVTKGSKTWTTKADFDAGSLSNVYCPIGLNQAELAYDKLSGWGEFILDIGLGKVANWYSFSHTKENAKTIWRDDFRSDSRGRYTKYNMPGWNDGAAVQPGYDATNKRLTIDTGDNKGTNLAPPVNIKNCIISAEVYVTGYYPSYALVDLYGRLTDANNWYTALFKVSPQGDESVLFKEVGGVGPTNLNMADWQIPKSQWRTVVFQLNGSSLYMHTNEGSVSVSDSAITAAKKPLFGMWQAKGYIRNILVEHYTLPSPVNNTLSFTFYNSSDAVDWTGPYGDISQVPNSRYLKVKTIFTRANFLASAMPVLKDMTVGYFAKAG